MMVVLLGVWIAIDPEMSGIKSDVRNSLNSSIVSFCEQVGGLDGVRLYAMFGLLGFATLSAGSWFAILVLGRMADRSIRSWMAMTGLIAMWLTCLGNWHEIGWLGKQRRAVRYVEIFEPVARALKLNWPSQGGVHAELGPFLAYPAGRPRSLLLMSCPTMSSGFPSFDGVELTTNDGVAFQMKGTDGGDWLEWHPSQSQPASYVTGLHQKLKLHRSVAMKDGWYLVRYFP